MAIYKRDLQVEKTARTNWLLYSIPGLDTMALKEEIQSKIGVEISLRYGMIAGSLKYVKTAVMIPKGIKWKRISLRVER